jgi:hypothetical protein
MSKNTSRTKGANKPAEAAPAAEATNKGEAATSARALLALITRIGTSANKLQTMIHDAAIGCLQHAETYGDAVPMQKLYLVLPKSQRREALLDWVTVNSPIRITQGGAVVGLLKADEKGYVPFNVDGARAVPFWEKDERAMKPMGESDFEKQIVQKLKSIEERQAKAAMPENANVVFFKPDFDVEAEKAKLNRQLAALRAA